MEPATLSLKAPDRSFPILAAAPLAAQGPDRYHDLLVAVAELVALEQRIGYTFDDKLLAISALRVSNAAVAVKSEVLKAPLEDWRRLALLGDRVLYLIVCQAWFESGRSRCTYHCQYLRSESPKTNYHPSAIFFEGAKAGSTVGVGGGRP